MSARTVLRPRRFSGAFAFLFFQKVEEAFLYALSYCYAFAGAIGITAYLVTIRDLHFYKKMSANLTSYVIWSFTTGVTFLYGLFLMDDFLFQFVAGASFGFCFLVLLLALRLRYALGNTALENKDALPPKMPVS